MEYILSSRSTLVKWQLAQAARKHLQHKKAPRRSPDGLCQHRLDQATLGLQRKPRTQPAR